MADPAISDRLKNSIVWFALGTIITSVLGTIAFLGFIDNRIKTGIVNAVNDGSIPTLQPSSEDTLSGAVIAFDTPPRCPEGWTDFIEAHGRTIVGVGHGSGLTDRSFRVPFGEEEISLQVAHLPKHSHPLNMLVANEAARGTFGLEDGGWFVNRTLVTPREESDPVGIPNYTDGPTQFTMPDIAEAFASQLPISISPPSMALFYCKKDG